MLLFTDADAELLHWRSCLKAEGGRRSAVFPPAHMRDSQVQLLSFLTWDIYSCLTVRIHKQFSHLKRYKEAKQGECQQRRDERVGETRGGMVTIPISGLEKRAVLLHGSFHQINRPRLSGEKLLKMDLLLLSSPPWHLVKTPLPLSCHWYVPLWAGVSPTLLRVKVSGTWEKAGTLCWSGLRHHSVGFFPPQKKLEERRDFSFQVIFFFIFCFLFSHSYFVLRALKHSFLARVPLGVLASAARFLFFPFFESKLDKGVRFENAADNTIQGSL